METFIVYPAIDLRGGQVVRLVQGDPARQTTYGSDPAGVARRWLAAGAAWLHVVNLDGAFGEADGRNRAALGEILQVAQTQGAQVQFGGGLRSLADVERALELGVSRAILGTAAAETPELAGEAVRRWGAERVALALDARDGQVQVRGWAGAAGVSAVELGRRLAELGLRIAIYTDIARDGGGQGLNVAATQRLAQETGLAVIASGGVAALDDVRAAKEAGLAGVIVGRALYDGKLDLREALQC